MCGINGLYYFDPARPVDQAAVSRMREVTAYRGPDDNGTYLRGNIGFAFNRLSIIDLSGGHQPMLNEDASVCLVFNGEIYNFRELREALRTRGYHFLTSSDTEVILHAWEEYGESCVDYLRGMFAFAVWDAHKRVLFAARDRIGIKPFYYYHDDECFAFASELKSLLELEDVPREVDLSAVAEFLHHGYVIAPQTILRNIKKLPPGHTLTVSSGRVTLRRYWDMPLDEPLQIDEHEALAQFDKLMRETLQMHLLSDVPLGAFLSGGVDSSSVVALMSRLGVSEINTFSIGYDSPESELPYAKLVADKYRTRHHELQLTPSGFSEFMPRIVWNMDEPVADAPSIPLYYLSQFARQQVKVVLSGEGADEIFAGYPIYNIMLAFEKMNRIPGARFAGKAASALLPQGKFRKYASMLGESLESRYSGVSQVFHPQEAARLLNGSMSDPFNSVTQAYSHSRGAHSLTRMGYLDLTTWLPDDLLVKADRMSMANSLELRVPFLDHKVVEFAARLPINLKIRRGVNKYLLKRYMESDLPKPIIDRAKKGFSVPKKAWFRNELAGFARESLLARGGAIDQFFPIREIERILAEHERRDRSDQIYALLIFDLWYQTFVKTPVADQNRFGPNSSLPVRVGVSTGIRS